MAIVKLKKDGYGQIELNQVTWRRDGRIEAQCELDSDEVIAENGMLFVIDNVKRQLHLATKDNAANAVIGVNYSSEHIYSDTEYSLRHFMLKKGDFLPRLGIPTLGDKFTTNTVCYDDTAFADEAAIETAVKGAAPVYAGVSDAGDTAGYWQLTKTMPTVGPVAQVVAYTDMPDGQPAVKLQMLKA